MSQRFCFTVSVGVAADRTGMSGISALSAGRLCDHRFVAVDVVNYIYNTRLYNRDDTLEPVCKACIYLGTEAVSRDKRSHIVFSLGVRRDGQAERQGG